MRRIAQFATRPPVLVLVTWALAVAVLAVAGRAVEQKLLPTTLAVPGTESYRHDRPAARALRGRPHRPPLETHLSGLFGRDLNKASMDAVHKGELIAFPVLVACRRPAITMST